MSIKKTAKDRALEVVAALPDDSSYEQILQEIGFERMIERGLADSEAGRTMSHEELGHRIERWGDSVRDERTKHVVAAPAAPHGPACEDRWRRCEVGQMARSTMKEEARRLIDRLPHDATWEDLQYAIYVRQRIARGREDIAQGRVVPHEEVLGRFGLK